jgi:dipeptidyl aminopeptidase/acylaminoacyl peptidase
MLNDSRLAKAALGIAALCMLVAATFSFADSTNPPPLLNRDVFFGDPEYAGAQISPDGAWISFRKPYRDVMNIWVKQADAPFTAAKPVTADTERPVAAYFWSEDGQYILYIQDKGGNENFHIYAVDPTAEPEPATGVPPARDLTPYENVRAMLYARPEPTPGQLIVGLNDRDPSVHDVYRVDIATGERELLITNEWSVAAWVTDHSGTVRLAVRQNEDGGTEILPVADGELGEPLYSCSFEETCVPVRFHKSGESVFLQSNKGADVDLIRLMLMDAETGAAELVESDPEDEVDFGAALFSDATEELIATAYVGDRIRIYPKDETFANDLETIRSHVPDGELGLQSTTEDMGTMLVSVSSDVDPGSVYVYRRADGAVEKLYTSRPDVPTKHMSPMQAIRYTARDGLEIPAYLTLPKGFGEEKLPTIILPHGGPWARDTWGFDPIVQFLANRGYAVLKPNFRGSTGYGKAFLNAGNMEWGTGAMQHDLTDGAKHLVEKGVADPEKLVIMGGSYGGYATLAGLAFTPDVYAAGVSIVGPSNIITLLDSIPPYWGPIVEMFHRRVGDPSDPEDRERLEAQSPLNSATAINDPLLVIQGANDPRVKKAESDQIVVALRELEHPVEYVVAPDEGHGFRGRENRLAMFAIIEEFLAEHVGGRYQTSAAPDVAERIAAITVDPATVEMPTEAEGLEAARTAELPQLEAERLQPVQLGYASTLAAAGREIEVTSAVTVARAADEEKAAWTVTTEASSPMGEGRDQVLLGEALQPIRRTAAQGPVEMEVRYSDDAINGSVAMGPQEMPIDVDLPAPVWASDEGLRATLMALPLTADTAVTYRTFDLQSQKVRVWSLEVAGEETVEVPAGTFDCFKLAVEALDDMGGGQSVWIAQDAPYVTVKATGQLPPQMGGGEIRTVLASVETQ